VLDGWRRRRGGAAPDSVVVTDEALLVLAQGGDSAAFETLVRRYTQPLYAFATRILGSADDAADVVQHTFIQCYNALPRLHADTALRPWFYRVARNRCLDLIRQRRTLPADSPRENEEEEADALAMIADRGPSLESLAERRDLQRLLAEAIAGLPPKYREVVVLRYEGDLTFGEIAETLGIPENSAKTLFQRAKTMLRLALREWVREEV
jgi:RNA polymerase sigma factor (sigma-70 family)